MRNFTLFCVFMTSKLVFCLPCPDHCQTCDSSKSCVSCKDGYWGTICELPCSRCQQETSCEKTNGFCLEKCKDGYTGILCDAFCNDKCLKCDRMNAGLCYLCAPGRYGVSCDKRCSEFCYNNTCNDNGYCSCISGYWGPKCENNCSSNCKNSSCDYQTGACTYGCTGIFIGSRCDSVSRQEPVILIVIVVLIVGLIVGILIVVCFIYRKMNRLQRRRTPKDNTEAPAEIPLLNKTKMKTSEDSGVFSKKSPRTSRTHETDAFMQKLPAGQEGSLEFRYVSGFRGDNTYLVCQDPTAETGESLWEMMWQRNCNLIVNLSSSAEETEEQKKFLKKKDRQVYDSITATCVGGTDFDEYEERQYELEKLTERKHVTEMQFSHWPADGFPESLPKLLAFHQKLEGFRTKITGHLFVYCSGGQSRSYTYIALDKALNELERDDNADVEPYLNRLRTEGLISSDEQYTFLRRTIDLWRAPWSTQTDSTGESQYPKDREETVSFQGEIKSTQPTNEYNHLIGENVQEFEETCKETENFIKKSTGDTEKEQQTFSFTQEAEIIPSTDFTSEYDLEKKKLSTHSLAQKIEIIPSDDFTGGEDIKKNSLATPSAVQTIEIIPPTDFTSEEDLEKKKIATLSVEQKTETENFIKKSTGDTEKEQQTFSSTQEAEIIPSDDFTSEEDIKKRSLATPSAVQNIEIFPPTDFTSEEDLEKKKIATLSVEQKTGICGPRIIVGPRAFRESSYVSDFTGPKAYIVCKDPTGCFNQDQASFWQMVWEEECDLIVKLSRTAEETPINEYWKIKKEEVKHLSFTVTNIAEMSFDEFTQRTFDLGTVYKKEEPTTKRKVFQMHFQNWPKDRFPEDEMSLLKFRQTVQVLRTEPTRPLLVHCSDGISRSCLYVALNIVLKELERQDSDDVAVDKCLDLLQEEGFISSEEQYNFLVRSIAKWKEMTLL